LENTCRKRPLRIRNVAPFRICEAFHLEFLYPSLMYASPVRPASSAATCTAPCFLCCTLSTSSPAPATRKGQPQPGRNPAQTLSRTAKTKRREEHKSMLSCFEGSGDTRGLSAVTGGLRNDSAASTMHAEISTKAKRLASAKFRELLRCPLYIQWAPCTQLCIRSTIFQKEREGPESAQTRGSEDVQSIFAERAFTFEIINVGKVG